MPEPGLTMPNATKYPWQWLWDSCFHSIVWSALGDSRCVTELESLFGLQLPNGFVPHMGYQTDPQGSLGQWHVPGRSDITQPPMYGHALRVLRQRGFDVRHLLEPATRGLNYLFDHRRDPATGLIRVVHPWETGCDDSNRFDAWFALPYDRNGWKPEKKRMEQSISLTDEVASGSPIFDVCSIGFSALTAFNALELADITADAALKAKAVELTRAIDRQWVETKRTWKDVSLAGPGASSEARTLDALLPLLLDVNHTHANAAWNELFDENAFWTPYGPAGTAIDEPTFDGDQYWRGPAWPQLTYLLMIAAERADRPDDARRLAEKLYAGAARSGFSEFWNPLTGEARGATPQGWGTLALEGAQRIRLRERLIASAGVGGVS